jgi:hypothetical protein
LRAVEGGVIECRQRAVDRGDRATDVAEQRVAVPGRVLKRPAVDPVHETHVVVAGAADVLAVVSREARRNETRVPEVPHGRDLGLEHVQALGGVGDLQHKSRAGVVRDAKVLVALARQRSRVP